MDAVQAKRERRDELAGAVFSTWVVTGLFLDGWAHHSEMVETFWTPWHAVLYSGFFVASIYAATTALAARRAGRPLLSDPLIGLGFLAFALGGVADAGWHTVFGVEEDLEALLSPTHLLLMIGGLLLTTSTLRSAWARPERAPSLRRFLPTLVGATLAVGILGFFLHFASPFVPEPEDYVGAPSDMQVALGVMGMLVTTVLLMGMTFVLRARWQVPRHTFLFLFAMYALYMNGLHGFDQVVVVLPAALAGALADAMTQQGVGPRLFGATIPAVLWLSWFATFGAAFGLDWTPDLWLGAVVFASLTGLGLSYLVHPPTSMRAFTGSAAVPVAAQEPKPAASVR